MPRQCCFSLLFLLSCCTIVRSAALILPPNDEPNKTVLLTGGAGFVGSHVAELLLDRGDKVVIVDEVNDYYDTDVKEGNLQLLLKRHGPDRVRIYRSDICNATLLHEIFTQEKPEWVCHLAARAGVRPSIADPLIYVHSNVEGTTHLLEMSRRFGVRNFVMASSSSVYGGSQSTLFDEGELVNRPISPYAATKKICELLLYTWHHLYQINTTALRFFTVYGPRGRPDMAPYKFIDRVSRGVVIQQYGDGSSSRDYTYISDIADGVVRAIDRPYPYQIFNLGKGGGTRLSDFVGLVEQYVGKPAEIERLPDQPGDVPYTRANVTRAQLYLGYNPQVPFEEGIRLTVEWYKNVFSEPASDDRRLRKGRRLQEASSRSPSRHSDPAPAVNQNSTRGNDTSSPTDEIDIVEPVAGPKRVLVTGAAGFIGSHVAEALLVRNDSVILVDEVNDYYNTTIKEANWMSLVQKYGTERVKIYRTDLCDHDVMTRIFRDDQPEWVCHLAARAGVRPSIEDPLIYVHSNVEATTRLLELSRQHGVKNFVFASSSSVYGGSASTFFREDEVTDAPISPYAATKSACELLAYTYHHLYGLPVSGLRFFTVYGPRGRPDMAPFLFIDRVSRGLPIRQFGDGTSSRDYTYIDDIVDGVVRAIDRPYPYQIFNLGRGEGTRLSDFIGYVEKYVGRPAQIERWPDQPGDVPRTCADIGKARRLLGYAPAVPFEEGVRRTVAWYKEMYGAPVTSENMNDGSDENGGSNDEDDVEPLVLTIDPPLEEVYPGTQENDVMNVSEESSKNDSHRTVHQDITEETKSPPVEGGSGADAGSDTDADGGSSSLSEMADPMFTSSQSFSSNIHPDFKTYKPDQEITIRIYGSAKLLSLFVVVQWMLLVGYFINRRWKVNILTISIPRT